MNITINDDGSARIETTSYSATYHANGNLKFSMVGKAPEKITINHPKKEIGELIYKVSVDTTELDKLEKQLNRIKQLMQDVGVKPKSNSQPFFQPAGQFFIKDAFINFVALKNAAVSYQLDQDAKAELADLRMKANQQDVAITELKRVMETQNKVFADMAREFTNKTWCSQK
ncbi:hypothetical protein [Proteus appendicitidis]|uniref:Uncharacterized protein n=1 Tax=Proteus appendicitidis TaxID=3034648 RepID=A0ABY8YCH7_9GAMM|nr:hypothetical protein [Proteus sp. HZ0627]WIV89963.1 hypothetical protein QQS39_08160 [Proteus sp. HZ0627]